MLNILNPENQEILEMSEDAKAFFRQNKPGYKRTIVGKWTYSQPHNADDKVQGGLLWDLFTKLHDRYYVTRNQRVLIDRYKDDLANILSDVTTIIDFGCGGEEVLLSQTVPLLNAFGNASRYIPVDINDGFLDSAETIISKSCAQINEINSVEAEFLGLPPITKKGTTLGLCFGSSTNFEDFPTDLIKLVSSFKKAVGKGGYLAFTIDTNQDPLSIKASYTHPLHIAHTINVMHRFKRDLNIRGDFDPYDWDYHPETEPMQFKGHDLLLTKHVLVGKRAMSFFIDGEHFTVNKGEEFIADQSYKISVELMDELCSQCGLSRVSRFDDSDNRIALLTYKVN